jgi:hypothetical protein
LNQVLHPVLAQDRKEILLLEISQEVQLLFQVRKQALTGFGCIVRGGEELLEELVGFIGGVWMKVLVVILPQRMENIG